MIQNSMGCSAMEEREIRRGNLVFAVNGERFELTSVDPSTTLLQFLRTRTRFKSVKLGCGEGGCGACVVLVSKFNPSNDQVEDYPINSCLTLLCSINGCSITTTEGLGNSKDGFHPIHQRFTGFHASQCGFCTPGMCVSLFSALIKADKTKRPNPSPGFSKLTIREAEKSVSGNLCRCTGYRPVADVCKSFANDVDIEDLGFNAFWNKEVSKEVKLSKLPYYDSKNQVCTFPRFLKDEMKSSFGLDPGKFYWDTPVTIEELESLLGSISDNETKVKLVVGNTGTGYYKELEGYDRYIDLRYIPELSEVKRYDTGIRVGAAVSISKAIAALQEDGEDRFSDWSRMVFRKIANHLEKIASGFIRNSASIGGNLVMAKRNSFPSDIATILLPLEASLQVINGSKRETITLEEFLDGPPLNHRVIILSVKIPSPKLACNKKSKLMFETYRAAARPLGSATAYLNAGFLADVTLSGINHQLTVNKIRLAFGAFGTKHAIRAREVEEFLEAKPLDYDNLYEAIKLVRIVVVPEDGTSHASYRSSLAVAFVFEFLRKLLETDPEYFSVGLDGYADSTSKMFHKKHDMVLAPPLLLPSKQDIAWSSEYHPIGDPIPKIGAALQASGEAVYVDDIPSPPNCLYGAFIYSTKPLAKIKSIQFNSERPPDGFIAIISYKDVPHGGQNIGSKRFYSDEPLFADDLTRCAGERIAFVVADTQKHADIAASLAMVEYDIQDLEPPILTVEDAVERCSFFEVPPFAIPKPVGDFSRGMADADHRIHSARISLPSQYYFYMETQTALAVPDEDNCMVVYSSSQVPEYIHTTVARCLGISEHNVRVITRRVGGGFGGKITRAMPVATGCALAAHVLRRPVRTYLNRKTDMIIIGGRHPMKITYSVGFKSDGQITALRLEILINAGLVDDFSPLMPLTIMIGLKKYNWGALCVDVKLCKTNQTCKSSMRAPGEAQGSFIAEAVIEHVASCLDMEVDDVRNRNFHTFYSLRLFYNGVEEEPHAYTLPSIWDKLSQTSNFRERVGLIKQFNKSNKWRKRGISRIPVVIELMMRQNPGKVSILWDGSVAVEVGGIEMGQGLWTKVKQMAAFGLRAVQCDRSEDLLDKVRVIQADTLSLIQGGLTAASTTSEASCEAVRICCSTLVERLKPIKDRLQQQMGTVTWETMITQAYMEAVNLSASTYYVPDPTSLHYLNYGAAVSEVEVNLLTGEPTILRSDIIYDCGQSLNPAVDLGQIEGAFVQGIGFFMNEELVTNSDGLVVFDSTFTYKIPTIDTIPKQLNVEVINSGHHKKRILSSKASGEPPLLLAASVHCATRAAVREARKQLRSWGDEVDGLDIVFQLDVPATVPVVKELCGLDIVERYLKSVLAH